MAQHEVSKVIDEALAAAGLNAQQGSVEEVMKTIREALAGHRADSAEPVTGGASRNDCDDEHGRPREAL